MTGLRPCETSRKSGERDHAFLLTLDACFAHTRTRVTSAEKMAQFEAERDAFWEQRKEEGQKQLEHGVQNAQETEMRRLASELMERSVGNYHPALTPTYPDPFPRGRTSYR